MPAVRASSPSSARDMWTLRPSTVTVTSLDRAISGPGREAMVPASRPGHRCQAEDPADPVAIQHAALTQLSGAAGGLLRRLEEEELVPGQLGQMAPPHTPPGSGPWRCGHRGRRHASARDGQRRRAGPWPPSPEARPAPPEMPRHRSSLRRTRRRRCGDGREHPAGQRGQNALDQLNRLRQLVIQLRMRCRARR